MAKVDAQAPPRPPSDAAARHAPAERRRSRRRAPRRELDPDEDDELLTELERAAAAAAKAADAPSRARRRRRRSNPARRKDALRQLTTRLAPHASPKVSRPGRGVASRRKAEELIAAGAVRVNGIAVTALGSSVDAQGSRRGRRPAGACRDADLPPAAEAAGLSGDAGARAASAPTLARYVERPRARAAGGRAARLPRRGRRAADHRRRAGPDDGRSGKGRVPMTYHLKLQGLVERRRDRAAARGLALGGPLGQAGCPSIGWPRPSKNTWIEMVVAETRPRALKAAGEPIRHSLLEDLARPPGRPVVRGADDGRLARSDQGRDLRPAPPRRPCSDRHSGTGVERVRAHASAFACDRNQSVAKAKSRRFPRALISVSDKTGLVELARRLVAPPASRSSRPAARRRRSRRRACRCARSSDFTGAPEILDGRVKTLHPRVHGGILGRPTAGAPRGDAGGRPRPDRSRGGEPLPVPRDGRARRAVRRDRSRTSTSAARR